MRRPKRNGREVKTKRKHENSSMGTLCSLANTLAVRVGSLWWLRVAHLLFRCTRASSFFMRRKVMVVVQQRLNHAALHSASCARLCLCFTTSQLCGFCITLCIFVCHGMYSVALCSRVRGHDDFIVIQRATSFSIYISRLFALYLVSQLPLSGSRAIAFQTFSSIFCTNRIFAVGAGGIARTSWERKTSVSQACLYDVYEPWRG